MVQRWLEHCEGRLKFPLIDDIRDWPCDILDAVKNAFATSSVSNTRAALQAIRALPSTARGPRLRVAIARTFTVETQLDFLELALACLPSAAEVRIGEFGGIESDLIDPASSLLVFDPDAVVVLWRYDDMFSEGTDIASMEDRVQKLVESFLAGSHARLFLSTFSLPLNTALSDLTDAHGVSSQIQQLNRRILSIAAERDRVNIFDFAGWLARFGASGYSRKMDLYARQPIAPAAAASFYSELARTLRPLVRPPAKVLALDLDNVLWGGVLGESSLSDLKIGLDYPGSAYYRIQRRALDLKRRGILLALVSKNNEADVVAAFSGLPDMPLSLSDFAARRVNWAPKHQSLQEIADELNLGLDSFVFLDDQAFEQEEVRYHLPMVKVLRNSGDPIAVLAALEECIHFDALRTTRADRLRSADYAAQKARRQSAAHSDIKEFLNSLELKAVVERVSEPSFGRALQMLHKTNQFNLTTQRHSESRLRDIVENPNNVVLTISLSDKFSDQGIIGLAIAEYDAERTAMVVDSFLLSCRAIGRGAEDALWSKLLEGAVESGASELLASYVSSEKNAQVSDLLDRLGMERTSQDDARRYYRRRLPASWPWPQWIEHD